MPKRKPGAPPSELVLWDPKLFLYVTFGTIGVVAVGSLYKTAVLAKGGSAVAFIQWKHEKEKDTEEQFAHHRIIASVQPPNRLTRNYK